MRILPPCVIFDCIFESGIGFAQNFCFESCESVKVFNFYLQFCIQKAIMTSAVKQQLAALANVGGTPKDQADR